jgi:transposase
VPRRSFNRNQTYLLPPAIDDWVPADHPIRFVAVFVDGLSRQEWLELGIVPEGEQRGAPAYDARLLLAVWLAGVMDGIRFCRALERACQDQISFRWLTGNQVPDHNTLWRFYRDHRSEIARLVHKTVRTAAQAGLVDLALLAVDGSKVAGSARRDRTMTAEELEALATRTEAVIAEVEAANAGEHAGPTGARLPAELQSMQALRDRIAAAQEQISEADGPGRVNLTDPDTRLHKTRQGYVTGYNAQAGVVRADLGPDQTGGLLMVAADVISAQDDHGQLVPMLEQSRANLGAAPVVLAADGGYHSAATVAGCDRQAQVVVMPESQGQARSAAPYHG